MRKETKREKIRGGSEKEKLGRRFSDAHMKDLKGQSWNRDLGKFALGKWYLGHWEWESHTKNNGTGARIWENLGNSRLENGIGPNLS